MERPPVWAVVVAALSLLVQPSADRRNGATLALAQTGDASGKGEDERGRGATTPSDIPLRGWKDILWRVYHNIPEHRVISIAAGVTFFVLLAIFPGIAALVAIYGLFADPSSMGQHLNDLSGVLPGGATQVIGDQLTRLTSQPRSQLGFALAFGVAVSLWSANAGMKALFDALNVVYGEKEQRGFIRLNAISLAFTLSALIFMMIALSAIAILPLALGYLALSSGAEWLVALCKWPLLLVTTAFGIALIYRYGPSRKERQWRWVSWGSAALAGDVNSILMVRGQLRQLRQNLRLPRRRRWSDDMDVAFIRGHFGRGRTRCRNGASNRTRHHNRRTQADGQPRRKGGRHRRKGEFLNKFSNRLRIRHQTERFSCAPLYPYRLSAFR
jgi:uncharacterized BrkB/YihY/UPF0761 family membrane protein